MKKNLFFAAVALVALASCSSEEIIGDSPTPNPNGSGPEKAIVFNTGTKATTRATGSAAATLLNSNFVFAGTKGTSASTFVFDQYTAHWETNTANSTESNSNDWEYVGYTPGTGSGVTAQSIKYWDYATTQYDFAAYSLGLGAGTTPTYATPTIIAAGNKSFTLTGSAEELKACYISDLVTAYNRDGVKDYGNVVTFSFRSLAAKIRVAFYETIPGYSVKSINFYSVAEGGTASETPVLFASSAVLPSGNGTMTITYPTTGWSNRSATDYNKAHVAFGATNTSTDLSSTVTFDALANYPTTYEGSLTTGSYIGRSSNTATYAGGLVSGAGKYYTILPYETGANLMLRIKYTLVSTDGSTEEINVDNATAVVPAQLAQWNPNYAYTYIFKISDMTNGSTGVDGDGKIVTGLTPITLNAVVVDSEDGVQETITTVSDPSITTYLAGKVITENDEYKRIALASDPTKYHPIYIIVNNGTTNETLVVSGDGINAELYTATVESGAVQGISEESVDNALTHGDNSTANTWIVTDAKGKKLTVTKSDLLQASTQIDAADSPNGNIITVPGAKFVPAATATTYVFRFKTAAVAAGYDAGRVLTSGTSVKGYYTKSGTTYTACADDATADGSTVYYLPTNAKPAGYQYKIIKVVAP